MHASTKPAGACPATPDAQKCEGPGHHPEANADHQTNVSGQDTEAERAAQLVDAQRKRRETVAAKLALRGYEMRQTADGTWLITRWNMARHAVDIDAAERFARQVGAV